MQETLAPREARLHEGGQLVPACGPAGEIRELLEQPEIPAYSELRYQPPADS